MECQSDSAYHSWTGSCGRRVLLIAALPISMPLAALAQIQSAQLQCEFKPVQPAIDFTFRFQTGYKIDLPMGQFLGAKHTVTISLRVTPDGGSPERLSNSFRLPDALETTGEVEITGDFIVDEGNFRVDAVLEDDLHRTCRDQWRIRAQGSSVVREMRVTMPTAIAGRNSPTDSSSHAVVRTELEQLTILMNAAPLLPGATKLRASDISMLVGSLSSILKQLPARNVTLIVFNLELQKVLLRQDGFTTAGIDGVAEAINELQLDLVNYSALQQPEGAVGILRNLVGEQFRRAAPSNTVVFLGPHARVHNPIPTDMVHGVQTVPRAPQVFYMKYEPPQSLLAADVAADYGRGSGSLICDPDSPVCVQLDDAMSPPDDWQDSIERLVKDLKGEVLVIRHPADLARAIKHMAARFYSDRKVQLSSGEMALRR